MTQQAEQTTMRRRMAKILAAAVVQGNAFLLLIAYVSGPPAVPFWLLMLGTSVVAVAASAPALLVVGRKWVFYALVVMGFIATTLLVVNGVDAFVSKGFNIAKTYAEGLVLSANEVHTRTGNWPNDLALDIPQAQLPTATTPWPYISDCSARVCNRVAGYAVVYELSAGMPHLVVLGGSGGWQAEWDWDKQQWRVRRFVF